MFGYAAKTSASFLDQSQRVDFETFGRVPGIAHFVARWIVMISISAVNTANGKFLKETTVTLSHAITITFKFKAAKFNGHA